MGQEFINPYSKNEMGIQNYEYSFIIDVLKYGVVTFDDAQNKEDERNSEGPCSIHMDILDNKPELKRAFGKYFYQLLRDPTRFPIYNIKSKEGGEEPRGIDTNFDFIQYIPTEGGPIGHALQMAIEEDKIIKRLNYRESTKHLERILGHKGTSKEMMQVILEEMSAHSLFHGDYNDKDRLILIDDSLMTGNMMYKTNEYLTKFCNGKNPKINLTKIAALVAIDGFMKVKFSDLANLTSRLEGYQGAYDKYVNKVNPEQLVFVREAVQLMLGMIDVVPITNIPTIAYVCHNKDSNKIEKVWDWFKNQYGLSNGGLEVALRRGAPDKDKIFQTLPITRDTIVGKTQENGQKSQQPANGNVSAT